MKNIKQANVFDQKTRDDGIQNKLAGLFNEIYTLLVSLSYCLVNGVIHYYYWSLESSADIDELFFSSLLFLFLYCVP